MIDVLIVGAGPAGTIAGLALARAGARVRIVDRQTFPRDKPCGDTINPGTLSELRRLGVASDIEDRGLPVAGMILTSENGAMVRETYPRGLLGRALLRRDLDWLLLQRAIDAGCQFEPDVNVTGVASGASDGPVRGVVARARRGGRPLAHVMHAPVTIGADGRRSTLAFGLGLARHPARPRRWAVGAYFEMPRTCRRSSAPQQAAEYGEMHIRRHHYIGVAAVPGGLCNVCMVKPSSGGDPALRDPASALNAVIAGDPFLNRFAQARRVTPPVVLGPLGVDTTAAGVDGVLLAGDAAGFIDPMTGDGLRFAVRGGVLAAAAALRALEHGWSGVHKAYAEERAREFTGKWRFNRALRAAVDAPLMMSLAAAGARWIPGMVGPLVARAGDCHHAR